MLLKTLTAVGREHVPRHYPYPDPLKHPRGTSQTRVSLERTIMYKLLIAKGSSFEFCHIFEWL